MGGLSYEALGPGYPHKHAMSLNSKSQVWLQEPRQIPPD